MSERATRASFRTTPLPIRRARLPFDRTFSGAETVRLRQGLVPRDMDDRWFVFCEDAWLYFHRSWSGHGIFWLRLEPAGQGTCVAEAWVSRDDAEFTSTDAGADAELLRQLIDRLVLA